MKIKSLVAALCTGILFLSACEKTEENSLNSIIGTYSGTLTSNTLKSTTKLLSYASNATAVVKAKNDTLIEIHCFNADFDTTFLMNYYFHEDSVMLCYSGVQFEENYGHMLGAGHMGGMMDDVHEGETEWMHHMEDEHNANDVHFGGFDMQMHTFSYRIQMMEDSMNNELVFEGTRE